MRPQPATGGSIDEFRQTFPDERSCAAYLFERRWPNGFVCPNCYGTRAASLKSRAYTYECLDCRRQTSITAGTVLHRSRLPLTLWFSAAYVAATNLGRISAREIERRLNIAYQTAWMLKQKLQLSDVARDPEPLQGIVEINRFEFSRLSARSFQARRERSSSQWPMKYPTIGAGEQSQHPSFTIDASASPLSMTPPQSWSRTSSVPM